MIEVTAHGDSHRRYLKDGVVVRGERIMSYEVWDDMKQANYNRRLVLRYLERAMKLFDTIPIWKIRRRHEVICRIQLVAERKLASRWPCGRFNET